MSDKHRTYWQNLGHEWQFILEMYKDNWPEGRILDYAVWSSRLSEQELAALKVGARPTQFPEKLIEYRPLELLDEKPEEIVRLRAENAKLRAELDRRERIFVDYDLRQKTVEAKLRAALEPYASWASHYSAEYSDNDVVSISFTVGSLRKARAALANEQDNAT